MGPVSTNRAIRDSILQHIAKHCKIKSVEDQPQDASTSLLRAHAHKAHCTLVRGSVLQRVAVHCSVSRMASSSVLKMSQ